MLLGLYLFLMIALPLGLGAFVALNGLPRTRICPLCTGETIRLLSRRHRVLGSVLPGEALHERWCPSCDWQGTTRVRQVADVPIAPAPAPGPEPASEATPEAAPAPAAGLEIRSIQVDDCSWRVHLECWAEADAWHGRLLFRGPDGCEWTEGRPLLTGRSAVDVLTQVLSLSDEALVGRIRKASR